jgi:uncharacterized iron-regulated protein
MTYGIEKYAERNDLLMKWIFMRPQWLIACAASLLLASCAQIGHSPPNHVLIGKVWDVSAQRFVDPSELMARAASSRVVLLGEIHDNPVHHQLQAWILEQMLRGGRRPALVVEQYDTDQQDKIDTVLKDGTPVDSKMHGLAQQMRKTWDWPLYEPIIKLALQQNLPLAAANLSRDTLRQVSRNDFSALGNGEEARLAIETVWSSERQKQLMQDVYAGHCGKVPDHVMEAIAKSQRARDAVMADTMLRQQDGAVAIVGRGHARKDMGVPLYLAARMPETSVLSVGLVEVNVPVDPGAYAYSRFGALHDYIWFTPAIQRKSNPCDSIPAPAKPAATG